MEPITLLYTPLYPNRWVEKSISPQMFVYQGQNIVLLLNSKSYENKIVEKLVSILDSAWALFLELVRSSPKSSCQEYNGKPSIAMVEGDNLTCGIGCGNIGYNGIELTTFYNCDDIILSSNEKCIPHYYFYEMGRNFYLFGKKFETFTTGFAVFMRYVCVDTLELIDMDFQSRKQIESVESKVNNDHDFLKWFTSKKIDERETDEKENRILNELSDQPVMFASVMLYLRKNYGGNDWVREFFKALNSCPCTSDPNLEIDQQCINWIFSASIAAKINLTQLFVDRWKLTKASRIYQHLNDILNIPEFEDVDYSALKLSNHVAQHVTVAQTPTK